MTIVSITSFYIGFGSALAFRNHRQGKLDAPIYGFVLILTWGFWYLLHYIVGRYFYEE